MTDLAAELEAIERIHGADVEAAGDLAAAAERIATRTSTLERERATALAAEIAVREQEADVEAQLAHRQRVLDDVDARIKRILELRARREAEKARRLARRAGVDLDKVDGNAVQRALIHETAKYLGIPYVWGGASPSQGFDCSGLVMHVYRKFGVGVLHGATLQARGGTPVPLSRLEPADLVFFGDASFYRHVGIYIGDGLFIEAPHTGDVVKVSELAGRNCAFACRYPIRLP
jgi:cell wall-associated NlpC family hydrolase